MTHLSEASVTPRSARLCDPQFSAPSYAGITFALLVAGYVVSMSDAWAQDTQAAKPSELSNTANSSEKLKFGNQAGDLFAAPAVTPSDAAPPSDDLANAAAVDATSLKPEVANLAPDVGSNASPDGRNAESPPAPLTFDQSVSKIIVSKLTSNASERSGLLDDEVAALKIQYGEEKPKLLWTTDNGLTPHAVSAIAELKRADTYALSVKAYATPQLEATTATPDDIAAAELKLSRAILKYARHAKSGRIKPGQVGSQLTQTPKRMAPSDVMELFANTADPGEVLRSLHPTHPQFVGLRHHLLELTGRTQDAGDVKRLPKGPILKKGITHEHVGLLRQRLAIRASSGNEQVFDGPLEDAVKTFQKKRGATADGIVGPGTRSALNGQSNPRLVRKIKLNMERWRWLPDDMDAEAGLHVWTNIAEFRVRVMKDYKAIFSERAIVGLTSHKTPVFSDKIEWIEIHPTWFVPQSIKVNDILPSLKRPTSTVVERYNLKLDCGAHGTNPKTIDWNKVDIRKCSFTQPAGPKSVLGDFKFKFPNKHSVYMHDTHKPYLFDNATRAYSHGCVRVKHPKKMAHILLENDKGMTVEQLDRILKGRKKLRTEKLIRHVPVHMTYFTAIIDDEGNLKSVGDPYRHDGRLAQALLGRSTAIKEQVTANSAPDDAPEPQEKQASWWQGFLPDN